MKRFVSIIILLALFLNNINIVNASELSNNEVVHDNSDVITKKEDSISEEIKRSGLYEDNKIKKFDDFMSGVQATHDVIEQNSKENTNITNDDLFVENCVIVKTTQDIAFDTSDVITAVRYDDVYYIQYETVQKAQEAIAVFETYPTVEFAEADSEYTLYEEESVVSDGTPIFYDPYGYNHLSWGIGDMGIDIFADYVRQNTTGRTTVAVVDSGIYSAHPFLQGRILDNGYDFIENDSTPNDGTGHGTLVA